MTNPEDLKDAPVNIETAKPEDIGKIVAIEEATWITTYPNNEVGITEADIRNRFNPQFKTQRKVEIEGEIQNPNHRYRLVKKGNEVIGYTHALKEEEYNDLVEIYIDPRFHGQKVGSIAMKDMLDWFGGDKSIRLEVSIYNKNAIAIYEHYGFVLAPYLQLADDEIWNVLPSGKRIPVQFMEKPAIGK